jgi:D-alanyl-D-alanine carboxypeptidase/D-alanyl-D-alanine-endopeptidase (penicillin-binding protein 4)
MDSLYVPLLQDSDNFIAEQLLLQIAASQQWPMDYASILDSLSDFGFLQRGEAPDEFLWFDGSGLSRYNLFTPRSLVWLLDGILEDQGIDRITRMFPAGGQSGTIRSWYNGGDSPYVFAKTGTLRNKHCLSGYIVCNSGKILIFSMMHNNYEGSSSSVKDEMQSILESIRNRY